MDKHTDKNQPKKQGKGTDSKLVERADRIEAQLKEFGAKLDKISSKADQAGGNTNADHKKRIDDSKAKYQIARTKFDEFRAAASDKRDSFKAGMESSWHEFETAFKGLAE